MGVLSVRRFVRPRIGLALGGGAARGFAHLGVIQALEEVGLPPFAIAGTSIGAIIGGLYAAEGESEPVRRALVEYISSQRFRQVQMEFLSQRPPENQSFRERMSRAVKRGLFMSRYYLRESFIPERIYRDHFLNLLPDRRIESLKLSFAAMASDILSGRAVVFRGGALREAVMASGAIPGVMPPLPVGDMILVDGVATDRVPARALLSMHVDVIIAVDVGLDYQTFVPPLKRGTAIRARSGQTTEWNLREIRAGVADVLIRPDVAAFNPLDFYKALPTVGFGRQATLAALPEIRKAIRRTRWRKLVRQARVQKARSLERRGWLGLPAVVLDGETE